MHNKNGILVNPNMHIHCIINLYVKILQIYMNVFMFEIKLKDDMNFEKVNKKIRKIYENIFFF